MSEVAGQFLLIEGRVDLAVVDAVHLLFGHATLAARASVLSRRELPLRFDQMVMIVWPDGWADTERICPDGRTRERAIWSNPKGGPKWGARSAAKPG